MSDFLKDNYHQLRQNFDREVVAESDKYKLLNDEGARNFAFYVFAQEEERHNPGAYQNFSEKQVPEVREVPKLDLTPTINGKPISNLETHNEVKRVNGITQEQIDEMRKTHPKEAAIMEELIENSPAYQMQGDDGSSVDMVKLYDEYAKKVLGAGGFGSASIAAASRIPANPIQKFKNYYGPQGPVYGHEKLGAPFTGLINKGPSRIGWTTSGNRAKFRLGRPGHHKHWPIPPIYGKRLPPKPKIGK